MTTPTLNDTIRVSRVQFWLRELPLQYYPRHTLNGDPTQAFFYPWRTINMWLSINSTWSIVHGNVSQATFNPQRHMMVPTSSIWYRTSAQMLFRVVTLVQTPAPIVTILQRNTASIFDKSSSVTIWRLEWNGRGVATWTGPLVLVSLCWTKCWCAGQARPMLKPGAGMWRVLDSLDIFGIRNGNGNVMLHSDYDGRSINLPVRGPSSDTSRITPTSTQLSCRRRWNLQSVASGLVGPQTNPSANAD